MSKACEKPDDLRFSTWPLLLEAHAVLLERLERDLEAAGGPPLTWYDVMVQLSMTPEGSLPMKELAARVLLSKSGVTRLVDRMVAEGYVERTACATDRRVVYAKITDKGREVMDRFAPRHIADVDRYFTNHLTDTEAQVMRKVLIRLIEAARKPHRTEEAESQTA
jgi:DNA-binding MarR family transcriptional regulator